MLPINFWRRLIVSLLWGLDCMGKRYLKARAVSMFLGASCLLFNVTAQDRSTRTPDLSGLSQAERESVEAACSAAKYVQGPAAYNQCLRDQLVSLSKGSRTPDLSGLTAEERQSIEAACSAAKYVQGPAAYNQCLRNQLASLSGGPRPPDLSRLNADERQSIEAACSAAKYVQGPAAYNHCLLNQLASLSGGPPAPDLSGLNTDERQSIEAACSAAKYVQGPAAYNRCLNNQLTALSQEPLNAPRPSRPALRPPTQPPLVAPSKQAISSRPAFAWPNWSGGISSTQLRSLTRTNLEPAELFKKVAPAIYAVLTSGSRDQMLAGRDVSQGSAVAVSKQELITNCHVVENSPFIVVIQKDHVTEAKLVKSNQASDRCVIRVESVGLSSIQGVRIFSDLSVGERVYSVGTPSGLEQTLGEGLISGLRENKGIKLIQTTAPISPGSSGGGLFDASGNLIGITTFMLRDTQALNFAIAAEEFWH